MTIETIDFVPEDLSDYPVHTSGDDDFWGPPQFSARVWLENRDRVIRLNVDAVWREPKADFTTFKLRTSRVLYDIRKSKGPMWTFARFDDQYDISTGDVLIPGTGLGLQEVYSSDAGLVSSLRVVGDSYGGWFGGADHPQLEITFNRVRFDVQK